mmetsp:Transcript_4211/g.7148  ORF Transcript_4211/g.7148 Transcript_4211/m.7148 type:complete len:224 (+) Transcript_4211:504-1175(+)
MVLLDVVSRALDVCGQVEVVLHESLVQEGLTHLQAVGRGRAVNPQHVELVQLLHQLPGLLGAGSGVGLLLEVEVALGDLVRALARVDDDIIRVLPDVLAEQVHGGGGPDRGHVEGLCGIDDVLDGVEAVVHMHFNMVVGGVDVLGDDLGVGKVGRTFEADGEGVQVGGDALLVPDLLEEGSHDRAVEPTREEGAHWPVAHHSLFRALVQQLGRSLEGGSFVKR